MTGGPPATSAQETIADDLLRGVPNIARYIGEKEKRTYYLCERGYIPVGKVGATWTASKSALRAHYAKITGSVAA